MSIFKKGGRDVALNYGPVSLTSACPLEMIIRKHREKFWTVGTFYIKDNVDSEDDYAYQIS